MQKPIPETTPRPWPDPPELEHMSGQFRLGYRQAQREAAAVIKSLQAEIEAMNGNRYYDQRDAYFEGRDDAKRSG